MGYWLRNRVGTPAIVLAFCSAVLPARRTQILDASRHRLFCAHWTVGMVRSR